MAVAVGVVPVPEGAEASLRDALAAALEANRQFAEAAEELRRDYARACEENARLREENAAQAAELEELRAGLAVLQRMVFGRSSEKSGPEPPGRDGAGGDAGRDRGNGAGTKRGPGARAGRRDYSHLPRFRVIWDFPGGGYCCPECGVPFTLLGADHVSEQLDWTVTVRVRADCRRRYRRGCGMPGPRDGDGARPAEGDREGPVHERVHRDAADGAVRRGAEHELAGGRSFPAGCGDLARDFGGDVRAGRGAAGAAGGRDRGAVARVVAPARGRDHVAGVRPARRDRPGEVVAVGVHRPGHRLLRDGPVPVRGGTGPARRHRREDRAAHGR